MPVATDLHAGFAVDLLRAVSTAEDNLVLSPWSVSSALAVLAPGVAAGPARREIERALAPRGEPEGLTAALAADATRVAGDRDTSGDSVLTVANTLWVDDARTPAPAFVRHLDTWPGAALRTASMASDPEAARAAINADVATTTRDLIPEILPAGSITSDERAVIVNALYLLVAWTEPFAETATADEPFHSPSGARDVATMRGRREASFARDSGWEYLALPLHLGLQAEILLPPAGGERPSAAIAPSGLGELRDRATSHRVDLHLPRFRIESGTGLVEPLRALGVRGIFDPGLLALDGIVVEERLYVSAAFHAAVLRVDESGIEGAAATAIVARATAFRPLPEVELRVDRPFFLLVTHAETRAVLFLARVAEP
jgi:serine protease inhibitor